MLFLNRFIIGVYQFTQTSH